MGYVLAAILWLAPQVGARAPGYAQVIEREASRRGIDPLLIVATIHLESRWKADARSATADYGLLQVHVSRTTYAEYLGREELLFEPRRNIRLGVALMAAWKTYHTRRCGGPHPWWSHLAWGAKVRDPGSGRRVQRVYQALRRRFRGEV